MEKNIDDLYFGVATRDFNTKKLRYWNLFENSRVKWSVARYVTMTPEEKRALLSDPLHFCFGDVWGRCEYEMLVGDWPSKDGDSSFEKVDVFSLYVEPNAGYLMSSVESVSVNSAKRYLREERKRSKGIK